MVNRSMDKKYVAQYGLLEKTHWWFIIRQRIILQAMRKYAARQHGGTLKILNVGAAAGGSSNWLASLGQVTSLENDPLFISYLKEQEIEVIDASVTNIPFPDESFDLVCAFDVIEHVADDRQAVRELIRVCKPGGRVCITVPAFQLLWSAHDVVNGHYRRYKTKQLRQLVEMLSAGQLYSSYFNSILFIPVLIFRKLQRLLKKGSNTDQSDFRYFAHNKIFNGLMKLLFGLEVFLLKFSRFPFGVSLIMLLKKNGLSQENVSKVQ